MTTMAERILQHLASLSLARLTVSQTWPRASTQAGIAEAMGINRAYVSLELKKLRNRDLIERVEAHIEGGRSRLYVYRPGAAPHGQVLLNEYVHCPGCGQEIRLRVVEG